MKYRRSKIRTLKDMERVFILAALDYFHGHRQDTAKAIGISVRALYSRIKEYKAKGYTVHPPGNVRKPRGVY